MSTAKQVFVVTGSNKGIGYAIVRGLAQKLKDAIIYLTARNPTLGEAALKKVYEELGNKCISQVVYHQLDITDETSCNMLANHLKTKYGQIDVLINNAGFAFKNDATESPGVQADITNSINYYGTKLISSYLAPLIRDGGRIVNVSSQAGVMKGIYSQALIDNFKRSDFTEEDVNKFVEKYKKLAHEDKRKEGGYPTSSYQVSKAATNAYTMVLHRELQSRNIIVNACCPGYVDTDMTSHKGHLTIDQGADTPIYLATDSGVPNGKFVFQRKQIDWL